MKKSHKDVTVKDVGLMINPEWPHVGASPDGLLICSCCKPRLIEIKCPTCNNIPSVIESRPYLTAHGLCKDHMYYYQVQCQLNVSKHNICDFVIWTKENLYIESIAKNSNFWQNCVKQINEFYVQGVLPELLARWYSNHPLTSEKSVDLSNVVCVCRRTLSHDDAVVVCSNESCLIKRYHLSCLRLKNMPKKMWLCYDCRVLNKSTK